MNLKIKTIIAVMLALVFAAHGYALSQEASPEPEPAAAAVATSTPTLAGTDESYAGEDVVPDNIKTMEDYQDEFADIPGGSAGFSVWRVIGSLAIIVFMIIGCVYLLRMTMSRGMRYDMKGRHIRVKDVVNLGLNRSLYLVEVGGRSILVGSSDKGLQLISDISGVELDETGGYGEEGGVDFAKNLDDAINKPGSAGGVDGIRNILEERLRRLEEDKE